DDKKDAGEIGAGHTVTAMYEIAPVGSKGEAPEVDRLKYQTTTSAAVDDAMLKEAETDLDVKRAKLDRMMQGGPDAYSAAELEEARADVKLREAHIRVIQEQIKAQSP